MILALAAVFAVSFIIEHVGAQAGHARPSLGALPARLLAVALLYAVELAVFDRPWLAALASVITLAILTTISIRKRQLVGEPLVFSDFGLIRLILRHPDLYYTEVLTSWPALVGMAALAGAIAGWLWLEPPLLRLGADLALLAGALSVVAVMWWAARRAPLAGWLRSWLRAPDLERHLASWGLLLTLVAYALRWRAELDLPFPPAIASGEFAPSASPRPDIVVVVQLESFMDPASRLGEPTPPGLSAAQRRAVLHGRLRVPAHGAYTMRSEFAVLSGLSEDELGFRRFDPYLTTAVTGAAVPATLASRMRALGSRTLFLHPFRPGFFDRETAVERLGFERCLWEADLAEAERCGPYIGDPALAARLLAEIGVRSDLRTDVPVFAMAVTMENHGPWPPGRLPGGTDARGQYLAHLANSDRAITLLVDGLSGYSGRALLCLYGDHPPILPCLDSAEIPETDYVLLELGREVSPAEPRRMDLTADELGRAIMSRAVPAGSGAGLTA